MTPPLPCNHQSCNHKIIWSCGNTWPYEPPPERESIICIHAKRCNCEWCCEHCPPKCECWELIPKMLCEKHKPPSPAKGPTAGCGCGETKNHWHESGNIVHFPNPKPQTAKCDKANQAGHHAVNNCGCLCCIPAIRRAVEAKIKEMAEREKAPGYWRAILTHEKELRELVEMVRKEGK